MDEEYSHLDERYGNFPRQEGMGMNVSYHANGQLIVARRGRDDCPTTEDSKEKARILRDRRMILRDRRMIRRDITFKL